MTEPNLRFPAVSCENLQFSVKICGFLQFPAKIFGFLRESAVSCDLQMLGFPGEGVNLPKSAVFLRTSAFWAFSVTLVYLKRAQSRCHLFTFYAGKSLDLPEFPCATALHPRSFPDFSGSQGRALYGPIPVKTETFREL